jgi:hypothetical protein
MPTKTQEVLAEMMVEPTGISILDSGGAYGRNWERNQGKTVQSFIDEPAVFTTQYGPEINVFHYCDHWLEFDEELDAEFNKYVEEYDNDDSPWLVLMEEFADYQERIYGESWMGNSTVNTYNHENILSQTLQYTNFEYDGEQYVLLQIHGGCDVRGGYTKPRVFRILEEGFGWDCDSFTIVTCDDRKGDSVTIDYRGGDFTHVEYENAWPRETFTGTVIDFEDWTDYWSNNSKCEWDEEERKFKCPDGDGHFTFEPSFY